MHMNGVYVCDDIRPYQNVLQLSERAFSCWSRSNDEQETEDDCDVGGGGSTSGYTTYEDDAVLVFVGRCE